jgi:hypothetical protein
MENKEHSQDKGGRKKYLTFYTCRRELVDTLTNKQKGEVLEALFRYAETGEKQQFNDQATQKVFSILCDDMEKEGGSDETT